MSALSKRLDKLHTPFDYLERPYVGVVCKHGESDEDAITRHGYDPEASVRFVIIRGVPHHQLAQELHPHRQIR